KTDDLLAILVDPPHELFFQSMHSALSSKPLTTALSRWERKPGPYGRCPKVPYYATALAVGRTPAAVHGAVRRLHRRKRSAGVRPPCPVRPGTPGKRATQAPQGWWACRRLPPRSACHPD